MTAGKWFPWSDRKRKRLLWVLAAFMVFAAGMCAYWLLYSASVGSHNPGNGLFIFLFGILFFPGGLAEFLRQSLVTAAPTAAAAVEASGGALNALGYLLYIFLALAAVLIPNRRVSFSYTYS